MIKAKVKYESLTYFIRTSATTKSCVSNRKPVAVVIEQKNNLAKLEHPLSCDCTDRFVRFTFAVTAGVPTISKFRQ